MHSTSVRLARRALLPMAAVALPALAQETHEPVNQEVTCYFSNYFAVISARIPRDQASIVLAGYFEPGDAQELLIYHRIHQKPQHSLYIQSADGAIWEYRPGPNGVNLIAAGAIQTAPNNADAWRSAQKYSACYGSDIDQLGNRLLDLFVPAGNYRFDEGVSWDPAHGGISGYGALLVFSGNGIAIESSNPEDGSSYRNHRSVLRGLSVIGAGKGSGLQFTPKSHETAHIKICDLNISGWDFGVEFGANAHSITLESCGIYFNNVGLKDNGTRDNSGENIRCVNSEIFNNAVTGFHLSNGNATYSFVACSIDYNGLGRGGQSQFDTDAGQFRYTDCHIEGGAQGPILRGNNANSKSTFTGCYFLQTQPSAEIPFLDLRNGAYLTAIGCQFAPHPATQTPILVRPGASLVDIDCYYNYSGPSPIVAQKGSRRASVVAATV